MNITSIEHLFTLLEEQGYEDIQHSAPHFIIECDLSYYNGLKKLAKQDLSITENTSDGYHTFKELYEFRMVYNAALFNEWALQKFRNPLWAEYDNQPLHIPKHDVHKSWRHNDGELCFGGGWFIVVANLPTGQISNHYEAKNWDLFQIPVVGKAKYEFDGHTSKDVLDRLINLKY